jgi:hypothetical protein
MTLLEEELERAEERLKVATEKMEEASTSELNLKNNHY